MNEEKNGFVYYPIIVTTLNRYSHFKRLVASLQRNTDSDKTEFVIGLDYPPSEKYREGYELIRDYLPTIKGFKKVTIFTTDENLGPYKNGQRLRDYIKGLGYDGYIFTEDDNEFAPNFIQYMNWGLNHFQEDQRIYAICGCNILNTEGFTGNVFALNNLHVFWGAGFWYNRMEKLDYYRDLKNLRTILDKIPLFKSLTCELHKAASILFMIRGGWAYGDTIPNFLNKDERWCVYPKITKVRNWGCEGSGVHGRNEKAYRMFSQMSLDEIRFFKPEDGDLFSQMMDKRSKIYCRRSLIQYLREFILVSSYKLTGRLLIVNRGKKWPKVKLQKVL